VPTLSQPGVPPPQLQAQGSQLEPAAQGGQAQAHAPPPLPPLAQSHSTCAQSALAGHAIGLTQAQVPPLSSRA
jgi:hypothetical protein